MGHVISAPTNSNLKKTMNLKITLAFIFISIGLAASAQSSPFEKLNFLLGDWEGTGSGFGNETSTVKSSFKLLMNDQYIAVRNESKFEATAENQEGELHIDEGYMSYDKNRKVIVYRQFNIEGYINTYVLNDSASSENQLVFETEKIENFVPGGRARWTIKRVDEHQIETIFDVSFPDKGYTCFGTNKLNKYEP